VAAAAVFLGTLYPLFVDALGFGKISVGPPYFNTVFVPLMVPMVLMMGLGPIARWKQASVPELWVRVRWAFAASLIIALLLPLVLGKWTPMIALGLMLAFWVITTVLADLYQWARGRCAATHEDSVAQLLRYATGASRRGSFHHRCNDGEGLRDRARCAYGCW